MIYVLFGPPGVGKTYIGQLISRSFDIPFFDADTLYDAEEMRLLQEGNYDQTARDKFVEKLMHHVESLVENNGYAQDLVVAEAFTKEKNRMEFIDKFMDQVCYIMVETPMVVAKDRAIHRFAISKGKHIINTKALEQIWKEFEEPKFFHMKLNNYQVSDDDLIDDFESLIQLTKRGGNV